MLEDSSRESGRKRKRKSLDREGSGEVDMASIISTDPIMNPRSSNGKPREKTDICFGAEQTPLELPVARVAFYVGSELHEFPQSRLFSYIWKRGLDSDCMVCGSCFVAGVSAPIRTIGFEYSQPSRPGIMDITQTCLSPHPLRIYNRHLACIKARKMDFIPVSHAWHEAIAKAQDGGVEDINAAWLAYQTPVKTLAAAAKKYSPVEIWHDYLSVPQWQKDVQQQLLLSIPAIYSYTESVIMHLDDVKASHLDQAYQERSYKSFMEGVACTIRSRWFDRMWVTLEYIQSKEVLVLSEEYEISEFSASGLSARIEDIAAKHVKRTGHGNFMKDIIKHGSRWARNVAWTDMESWKSRPDKHRTLGAAIYILGMKQCSDPRDQYMALGGMVDFTPSTTDLAALNHDRFDYFLSVALHALASGDYTPLLMNPLPGESPDPRAPWLRGHIQLSDKSWDLGVCHRKARSLDIIKDGVIQPKLESVGVVEWFEYTAFDQSPEIVLGRVVIQILRASGTCPVKFYGALDRIFTRIEMKALYTEWDTDAAKKPTPSQPFSQYPALGELLESFSALMYTATSDSAALENPQVLEVVKGMIKLLELDKPGKQSADSRMSITHAEAQYYLDRYSRDMNGLGRIRCKFCGQRSLFRLSLWEDPRPEATQVYRIPGLLFDETISEGVGLVVTRGVLIGKMSYGTPSCDCCRSERLYLGPATVREWNST